MATAPEVRCKSYTVLSIGFGAVLWHSMSIVAIANVLVMLYNLTTIYFFCKIPPSTPHMAGGRVCGWQRVDLRRVITKLETLAQWLYIDYIITAQ